jgi:hypothetical protein
MRIACRILRRNPGGSSAPQPVRVADTTQASAVTSVGRVTLILDPEHHPLAQSGRVPRQRVNRQVSRLPRPRDRSRNRLEGRLNLRLGQRERARKTGRGSLRRDVLASRIPFLAAFLVPTLRRSVLTYRPLLSRGPCRSALHLAPVPGIAAALLDDLQEVGQVLVGEPRRASVETFPLCGSEPNRRPRESGRGARPGSIA